MPIRIKIRNQFVPAFPRLQVETKARPKIHDSNRLTPQAEAAAFAFVQLGAAILSGAGVSYWAGLPTGARRGRNRTPSGYTVARWHAPLLPKRKRQKYQELGAAEVRASVARTSAAIRPPRSRNTCRARAIPRP